ncbi:MAG: hypothetical protein M3483_05140 [Gemmatimonadota bacterium]|nr:hypothetical protein [Gemmatimonadota bacterium]
MLGPSVLAHPTGVRRDHRRGALYGFGIGAFLGSVGFATLQYVVTGSHAEGDYFLPSLVVGAAAGGAVGAAVGAVLGAARREEPPPEQTRLQFIPTDQPVLTGRSPSSGGG